jgi:hypothetical protein
MADTSDTLIPGLLNAILLVDEAIALAEKGLLRNPTTEEGRSLNRALLRLKTEREVLDAELDAALEARTVVQGPTASQIAEIGALTDQVERAANDNASVSAGLALVGKVLDLAGEVVSHT